ncbi:uncharacterized protein LOC115324800 isoform X1 [Ixodes scapularis]|uniref:uncharacterized protein LOC115324800 isoform X1 n=1 Tax=Ixodes scapularis TaxID=6945 RepID=UPI001C38689E|nr:uncharacterized protein LOC115324800 isoform X1 [Ixodes scapularis]
MSKQSCVTCCLSIFLCSAFFYFFFYFSELANAVSDVRLLHEELREMGNARNAEIAERQAEPEDETEDIGGFMVSKSLLKMVELGPTKTATSYARELLRQIFPEEELMGKSISGKQSNAQKDKDAKPQLDPVRVNAVVKHTCNKYKYTKESTVRTSLSTMLNKLQANHMSLP